MRRTRCYEDPLGKIEHSRDCRGFLALWVDSTLQLYQLHPIRTQRRVSLRFEPKTRLVFSFCRVVEPIRVFQRQRLAPMPIVGETKVIESDKRAGGCGSTHAWERTPHTARKRSHEGCAACVHVLDAFHMHVPTSEHAQTLKTLRRVVS